MRHQNIRTRHQSEVFHPILVRTQIALAILSGRKPRTFKRGEAQCITDPSPAMGYNRRDPCYIFHRGRRTKFYVSSA